ncbi:MAG: hypothetical protein K2N32_01835 [Clostridia bacterium]|nr:hypothetical protein [Clostridia bacterium]
MEKYLTEASSNIRESVADACSAVMPGGHVGVCCQSKDREYAQSVVEGIPSFEYKITFVEYPDGVEANDDTATDIVKADDDIRFFVGVGDAVIASLLARATLRRDIQYILVANSPDIDGVGFCIDCDDKSQKATAPARVFVDASILDCPYPYADLVASIFSRRVSLIEKKYVNYLSRRFDENKLLEEEMILDGIIADGMMNDRKKLFDGIMKYASADIEQFESAHYVMTKLLGELCLTSNVGDCKLLCAITLLKYFKTVLSVEDYHLTIPLDISPKCRRLAKLLGTDISEIISKVQNRKYQGKWLYIHSEYREDLLAEVLSLEEKSKKIIKSAKRFMPDVGYHLGEDFDSNYLLELVYNLSPLTDDCSLVTMADIL